MQKQAQVAYLNRKVQRDRKQSTKRRDAKHQKQLLLEQISSMKPKSLNTFIQRNLHKVVKGRDYDAVVERIQKRVQMLRQEERMERAYKYSQYSEEEENANDEFSNTQQMVSWIRKTPRKVRKQRYQREEEEQQEWEQIEAFEELSLWENSEYAF